MFLSTINPMRVVLRALQNYIKGYKKTILTHYHYLKCCKCPYLLNIYQFIESVQVPPSPHNSSLTPINSRGLFLCVRLCVRYSLKLASILKVHHAIDCCFSSNYNTACNSLLFKVFCISCCIAF